MSQLRNFCGRVFGSKQRKFVFAAVLSSGMLFANVQSVDADGGSWGGSLGSGGSRGGSLGSGGSRGGSLGSGGGLSRGGFLGGSGPIRNLLGRIGSRNSGGSGGSSGGFVGGGSSGGSLGSLGSTGSAYSHVSGGGSSGGSTGGSTGYGFGSSGASYGSLGSGYLGSLDSYDGGYSSDGAIYSGPQETSFSSPVYDSGVYDGGVQHSLDATSPSGVYIEPSNGIPAPSKPSDGADSTNQPTPPGLPGPEADDSTQITRPVGHRAVLKLVVPRDAVVFINDKRTTTEGETRSYVSRNLKADSEYHYNVKAVVTRDGKEVVRTQLVAIATGESKTVAMDFDSAPTTSLALNVPADATVKLCGKETSTSGVTRHYVTSKLDEGMTWKNYTVEVSVVRDGKVVTQERTMNLLAGETYSLDFDFDAAAGQIVSR